VRFCLFFLRKLDVKLCVSNIFEQKQVKKEIIAQEVEKVRGMLKIKAVIALMALLLCVCIAQPSVNTAYAAEAETQTESLSLHRKNPDENLPFQMTNMFPGDSETRYYRVKVSYTGTITVFFQAKPDEANQKLGDVLKMKVRLVDTGEMLYEGSIVGMPVLEQELTTDSKAQTDELCYEITVSLGTEVGNEYQNKQMTAELIWWAEGSESETTEATEGETTDSTEGETTDTTEGGGGSDGELVDPPYTGDNSRMLLWLICACLALAVILMGVLSFRKTENAKGRKKPWLGIFMVIFLTLAFGITSFALMYQKVMVEGNLFKTGKVSISLNDNEPVFNEEILFEPGMRIVKDFTLRNDSTCEVYYRLWFSDIEGDFADVLEVRVADGENVIFEGTFSELNGVKSEGANGKLAEGEERLLSILFYVPEDCENVMQENTLLFDLNAEAVQVVNNPDGVFE